MTDLISLRMHRGSAVEVSKFAYVSFFLKFSEYIEEAIKEVQGFKETLKPYIFEEIQCKQIDLLW